MLPPFELFLREHQTSVYRFLLARLGPAEAADCFQETFIAALRGYDDLPSDANARAWLFKIAERKAIDAHRSRNRRPVPHEAVPEPVEISGNHYDPVLWNAVRALPDKQRAAVVHRFVNDLPYAEIGEVIGCSEAAARQNVRAGLRTLRERWAR